MAMNISPQDISGVCNLKCSYSYNYPITTPTITNYSTHLVASYINSTTSSVSFNDEPYNIADICIFSPSLHTYNNTLTNGEIVITHAPVNGGNVLFVCIPISETGVTSNATNILSNIVNIVSTTAPTQGESATQGINEFTPNDLIPKFNFYSYTSSSYSCICFGLQQAIYISSANLQLLQQVIQQDTSTQFPSGPALYSSLNIPKILGGPSGSDIYIDCQPTNSSDEDTNEVVAQKSSSNSDIGLSLSSITSNPIFLLFVSSIIFIIIIFALNKILSIV